MATSKQENHRARALPNEVSEELGERGLAGNTPPNHASYDLASENCHHNVTFGINMSIMPT